MWYHTLKDNGNVHDKKTATITLRPLLAVIPAIAAYLTWASCDGRSLAWVSGSGGISAECASFGPTTNSGARPGGTGLLADRRMESVG
jgi:hypothetical protein